MKPNTAKDVWKFIAKASDKECWLWTGGTFSGRYGRFFFKGKPVLAHRFVCQLVNGEIPEGMFVLHKCNNKLCCNPAHLKAGTNSENQRHASASGAFEVGESGIKGIGFIKSRGYWQARGYRNGKFHNLYTGPSKEKAIAARKRWESMNDVTFNIGE